MDPGREAVQAFDGTYQEALSLTVEVRDYLRDEEPRERGELGAVDRLTISCEAMRLTSRLTQIMAWLMMQRAVSLGEVSAVEAARAHNRLSGHAICRDRSIERVAVLPDRLSDLVERSRVLFERVAELDELVAEAAGSTVH